MPDKKKPNSQFSTGQGIFKFSFVLSKVYFALPCKNVVVVDKGKLSQH